MRVPISSPGPDDQPFTDALLRNTVQAQPLRGTSDPHGRALPLLQPLLARGHRGLEGRHVQAVHALLRKDDAGLRNGVSISVTPTLR